MTAASVTVRDWGWRYAGRRSWACRGIDLRIKAGERVLVVGASGGGKSTLLRGVAGLLDEQTAAEHEGSVHLDGVPAAAARHRIGMLFQDPETSLVMSRAGDDVAFGLENAGVPRDEIWPRVDAALASVGFGYGRERPTAALSGGEQQRLALAGALVRDPSLLILDEPTANLDPPGAADVLNTVDAVVGSRGTTLLMVEHQLTLALDVVERLVVLDAGGGVLDDGSPHTVFSRHGARLRELGVWVPAPWVAPPPRRTNPPVEQVLTDASGAPAAPATGSVIHGKDLAYRYRGADQSVFDHLDIELAAGEVTALVGPNGSGKSTLAMLLAGLMAPERGSVHWQEDPARPLHRWRARDLCRQVGTVFQDPEHQFLTARVDEELLLGPRRTGQPRAAAEQRCQELLARLRLDRLAAANPFTLSGGEKRRLSVATALATAPAVLVLDEPTFGQDARTWTELVGLCEDLRDAGTAILTVTHDEAFVDALADRRVRLR